jgi:hypothetical protein
MGGERAQTVAYKPSEALKFDIFKVPMDESYQSKNSEHSPITPVKEFVAIPKRNENDPKEILSKSPQVRPTELEDPLIVPIMGKGAPRSYSSNVVKRKIYPSKYSSIPLPGKKLET